MEQCFTLATANYLPEGEVFGNDLQCFLAALSAISSEVASESPRNQTTGPPSS